MEMTNFAQLGSEITSSSFLDNKIEGQNNTLKNYEIISNESNNLSKGDTNLPEFNNSFSTACFSSEFINPPISNNKEFLPIPNNIHVNLPEFKFNKMLSPIKPDSSANFNTTSYDSTTIERPQEVKLFFDEPIISSESLIESHSAPSFQNSTNSYFLPNNYNQGDATNNSYSIIICIFPFFFDSPLDLFENLNYTPSNFESNNSLNDDFLEDKKNKKKRNDTLSKNLQDQEIHNQKSQKQNNIFVDFFLVYNKSLIKNTKSSNTTNNFYNQKSLNNTNFASSTSKVNSSGFFLNNFESDFPEFLSSEPDKNLDSLQYDAKFYSDQLQGSSPNHSLYNTLNSFPISSEGSFYFPSDAPPISNVEDQNSSFQFCIQTSEITNKSNNFHDNMPDFCPDELPLQCIPRSMACRLLPDQFPDARFIGACPINKNGTYFSKTSDSIRQAKSDTQPNSLSLENSNLASSNIKNIPIKTNSSIDSDAIKTSNSSDGKNWDNCTNNDDNDRNQNLSSSSTIWSLRFSRMDGFIWEEICKLHHFGVDSHKRNIWSLQFLQIGSTWDYLKIDSYLQNQTQNLEFSITRFANQFPQLFSLHPSSEFESTLLQIWTSTPNSGSLSTLPEDILRELSCVQKECQLEQQQEDEKQTKIKAKNNDSSFFLENTNNNNSYPSYLNSSNFSTNCENSNLSYIKETPNNQVHYIQDVLGQIVDVFKDFNFVSALSQALEINEDTTTQNVDKLLGLSGIDDNILSMSNSGDSELRINENLQASSNENCKFKISAQQGHLHTQNMNQQQQNTQDQYFENTYGKIQEESLINPWNVLQRAVSTQISSAVKLNKKNQQNQFHNQTINQDSQFINQPVIPTEIEKLSHGLTSKRPKRALHIDTYSSSQEQSALNLNIEDAQRILKKLTTKNQISNMELCEHMNLNFNTLNKFLNNQLEDHEKIGITEKVSKFLHIFNNKQLRTRDLGETPKLDISKEPKKIPENLSTRNPHKRSKLSGSVVWVHYEDCQNLDDAKLKVISFLGYKYLHTGKTTNRYVRNYVCNRHQGCSARSRIVNDNLTGKVWIETLGTHTTDNSFLKGANSTSTSSIFDPSEYEVNNQATTDNTHNEAYTYLTKRER